VILHLVVSTIVLLAAILAARLLPLTARTRHALLLCGLAKFALPSEALARLLHLAHVDPVLPSAFRILGNATAASVPAPANPNWLLVTWAAVATLILGRWLLLRARTVRAALHVSQAPSSREVRALAEALGAMGVRAGVDVVRSSVFEAPAVLRIVRPVIVLPDCDTLDDRELHALLCHECAHVARHDNLIAFLTAAAGAALWFHPLVWLALRDLSTTREQACDERVAETTGATVVYLEALAAVCSNVLTPRPAGISCMASAHIKERMEHLMNYERFKQSALSHRAVVAAAIVAVVAITTVGAAPVKNEEPYRITMKISDVPNAREFAFRIVDASSGELVLTPHFPVRSGEAFQGQTGRTIDDEELTAFVEIDTTRGVAVLDIKRNGAQVQHTTFAFTDKPAAEKFTGEPITLNLKDADLKDVLRTFGDLTGLNIAVDPGVSGKVTVALTDVPWDQALDLVARQNNLTVTIEGKIIRVSKN
jgi:beta-lactamase regulating signal transducer with metallopeptidase domain